MSVVQFDAAPKLQQAIIPRDLIDVHVLQGIEKDMDPEEKLCAIFFLIEDYVTGLQQLLNIGDNEWCISEFIKAYRVTNWEAKLMEALCLLQNYEILSNLGVNPEDAKTVFLPMIREVTYVVNKHAKACYSLFESLSSKDAQELLDRVYKSDLINPPDIDTWPKKVPLELHLLWWIQSGFIKIHEDKWCLKNLLKILKELNMSGRSVYETLKNYDFNTNDNNPCHLDYQTNNNSDTSSNIGKSTAVTDNGRSSQQYKINNGLVIIFNQMNFPPPTKYEYRQGSDVDCRRIITTFENTFGFETEVHDDLGQREIFSQLDKLSSRGKKYDCVVVFVLSHGTYGNIVASDGVECNIETIRSKFCCESLKDKPKVLVLQACQKPSLTTDGPRSGQNDLGRFEDLLTLSSTIPGEFSVRDRQNGAWFIAHLCEVLTEKEGRPVEECLRNLSSRFKEKAAEIDGKVIRQVPEYRTTLSKLLVFPWKARAN